MRVATPFRQLHRAQRPDGGVVTDPGPLRHGERDLRVFQLMNPEPRERDFFARIEHDLRVAVPIQVSVEQRVVVALSRQGGRNHLGAAPRLRPHEVRPRAEHGHRHSVEQRQLFLHDSFE